MKYFKKLFCFFTNSFFSCAESEPSFGNKRDISDYNSSSGSRVRTSGPKGRSSGPERRSSASCDIQLVTAPADLVIHVGKMVVLQAECQGTRPIGQYIHALCKKRFNLKLYKATVHSF
jgi:hypothetical protein